MYDVIYEADIALCNINKLHLQLNILRHALPQFLIINL
jgi:hypothetical protein